MGGCGLCIVGASLYHVENPGEVFLCILMEGVDSGSKVEVGVRVIFFLAAILDQQEFVGYGVVGSGG